MPTNFDSSLQERISFIGVVNFVFVILNSVHSFHTKASLVPRHVLGNDCPKILENIYVLACVVVKNIASVAPRNIIYMYSV